MQQRETVVSALCAFVSWSSDAKVYAKEAGFGTTLLALLDDRIGQLHLDTVAEKMSVPLSESNKIRTGELKKKDLRKNPAANHQESEIVRLVGLLTNLLFQADSEFKAEMVARGLTLTVQKLLSKPTLRQHERVIRQTSFLAPRLDWKCDLG